MTTTRTYARFWIVGCCLWFASQTAHGQIMPTATAGQARRDPTTPALKYFGRGMPTPATRPQQRRQAPQTAYLRHSGGKPFQDITRPPVLSRYLSLDAVESSVGLPNYYTRVLPQFRLQQDRQEQSLQLRRLRQQVRLANVPGTNSNHRNGETAVKSYGTQFLNVGGYFPPVQR
jgi:hypothetical protein